MIVRLQFTMRGIHYSGMKVILPLSTLIQSKNAENDHEPRNGGKRDLRPVAGAKTKWPSLFA